MYPYVHSIIHNIQDMETSKYQLTDEWIKKIQTYVQWDTTQPQKEQNNASCSNTDLEIIIPSEVNQEKGKHCMVSFICGIQYGTNEHINTKQTQTHRHREQTCGCSLRPYHPERARSCLILGAKQGWAWLVFGWENRLVVVKRGGVCRGMEWEAGISRWKLLMHTEWINNKVLLYSSDHNVQHPMINHNGKECKKREGIYL